MERFIKYCPNDDLQLVERTLGRVSLQNLIRDLIQEYVFIPFLPQPIYILFIQRSCIFV